MIIESVVKQKTKNDGKNMHNIIMNMKMLKVHANCNSFIFWYSEFIMIVWFKYKTI